MIQIGITLFVASAIATPHEETLATVMSGTAGTRQEAIASAMADRDRLEQSLARQLSESLAKPDRSYLGRTHSLLRLIARVRATNAVERLVHAAAFTLDPATFPHGADVASTAYYPVAQTLAEIGDKNVIRSVLRAAESRQDNLTLHVFAWILREIVDENPAIAIVEQATVGKASGAIANLERLKEILQKPASELPIPGFKDKRTKSGA